MSHSNPPAAVAPIVHDVDPGACAVAVANVELRAPHVGSGLVVCISDGHDVGGVCHVLAAASGLQLFGLKSSGLFIGNALPMLLGLLRGHGARPVLRATLIGAATSKQAPGAHSWAQRTLEHARALCEELGVPVVHEIVGGTHVREVVFDGFGNLRVRAQGQTQIVSMQEQDVPLSLSA